MRHSQALHKKSIKKQIRSKLSNAELEAISLTDNYHVIHWLKPEKEFLFNGEMYDVVRSKIENGKIVLYCINDKEEKALVDNYNLITKHNSSSDKKGKHTVDSPVKLFVKEDENIFNLAFTLLHNSFHSYDSDLPDNITDKISPPPKA